MKNIIKHITENIRPPLLALITLFIAASATGQSQQTDGKGLQKIACGSYPANGIKVQSASVTYAGGNGCITIITPGKETVYFTARDSVLLKPGFIAKEGSKFIAYIDSSAVPADVATNNKSNDIIQSSVGKATLNSNDIVSVAPNPFNSTFVLSINSAKDTKAQLIIYNAVGVSVKQQTGINISKGINRTSLNCLGLANGVYTLEIISGDSRAFKKIVKN